PGPGPRGRGVGSGFGGQRWGGAQEPRLDGASDGTEGAGPANSAIFSRTAFTAGTTFSPSTSITASRGARAPAERTAGQGRGEAQAHRCEASAPGSPTRSCDASD
ncbi:hypothetical protein ADK54_17790, partial [Streptomyces sp. WM6378]